MTEKRRQRRMATGIVQRGPKDKTISVASVQLVRHPRYRRYVRRTTRYQVHDELQQARPGDVVEIMETRPISKTKSWRLVRIVTSRAEKGSGGDA